MSHRGRVTGWALLLSAAAAAPPATVAAAEETYVGTATRPTGAPPASLALRLTIREYTSDDKAFAMAERLHQGGPGAAATEMAKGDAGTVRLGEQTYRATLIRVQKTDTGRILRIVTDRPLQPPPGRPPTTLPAEAVGYLELQLGAAGEGSGRLITAARATFDAEGFVVPESLGEVWTVSKVKPGP